MVAVVIAVQAHVLTFIGTIRSVVRVDRVCVVPVSSLGVILRDDVGHSTGGVNGEPEGFVSIMFTDFMSGGAWGRCVVVKHGCVVEAVGPFLVLVQRVPGRS